MNFAVPTMVAAVSAIKRAFYILTALALTSYKFPENKILEDGTSCDYVIVGAGTAGSIVANRLTEDPGVTVCLIEAGGDPPLEAEMPYTVPYMSKTYLDWNFTAEDDGYTGQYTKDRYLHLPTGKVLGGSSTVHHLFYSRGDPRDYHDWVRATGDDSWSWQNLLPYFIKSERFKDEYILNSRNGKYHGKNGYLAITRETRDVPLKYLEAFNEVGNRVVDDVTTGDSLGYTRSMLYISDGVRQSTAETYLARIKNRQNLYVMKNTLVTKINFDETNRATGVQCTTSNRDTITVNAKREVIVSAGTFNSAKLLMLSGVGPKEHLESMGIEVISNLPVGENLQDDLAVIIVHKAEVIAQKPEPPNPSQNPLQTFTGYVPLNDSQTHPDYMTINIIGTNEPDKLLILCSIVFGMHDDVCEQVFFAGINREILITLLNVVRTQSRGRVLLRSANPEDPPKINMGYLSNNGDLEKFVDSIMDFRKVRESNYFKDVVETIYFDIPKCRGLAVDTREYWKCYILNMMTTFYHYSCTCPMGTVLDSELRVNGVDRLRVVDGSALPNLISGKVMSAVAAMAEKASDIIKQAQGYS